MILGQDVPIGRKVCAGFYDSLFPIPKYETKHAVSGVSVDMMVEKRRLLGKCPVNGR